MNFLNNLFGNNNRQRRSAPREHVPPTNNTTNNTNNNTNNNPRPRSRHGRAQARQQRQQQEEQERQNRNRQQQQPQPQQQQPQQSRQQQQQQQEPGMEQIFAQIFGQAFNGQFQQHHQQQQQGVHQPTEIPPASDKAIRTLPTVMVTPEDLVDESNRECCICFDSHELGDKVCRLPCAHIFHPQCITEWLNKHCTCPICRYELPTSNPLYESNRLKRMSTRKPRFATYELHRMKIGDLKDLCVNKLKIPVNGMGYTKQEIIDLIKNSSKIEIITAPPPVHFNCIGNLRGMGVGRLKRTMMDAGVFFDSRDVIEKEDMVQIFINSGRIVFDEEEKEEKEEKEDVIQEESVTKESFDRQGEEVKRARIGERGNGSTSSSARPVANNQQQQENESEIGEQNTLDSNNNNDIDRDHDHSNFNTYDEVIVEDVLDDSSSSSSVRQRQPLLNDDAISLTPSIETMESSQPSTTAATDTTATTTPRNNNENERRSTSYSYNDSADITSRSVGELRQLAQSIGVDISNCLEKREMIELIVTAMSRRGLGTRYGGGVIS